PEHVINFMYFVAEELRQIMADLGFRSIQQMVGQSQKLDMNTAIEHYKAQGIEVSKILYKQRVSENDKTYNTEKQEHHIEDALDFEIIRPAHPAVYRKEKMSLDCPITNTSRTTGAILSNEISKIHGENGLPEDTLHLNFKGAAGQSFGAFATKGLTM